MDLTADALRVELGFTNGEWTSDDTSRAETVLDRSRAVVVAAVGAARVARAQSDADSQHGVIASDGQAKLDALDEAVLEHAKLRFVNPERVMQRRQGADNSVSFSDSSEAATGRKEVESILRGAFGNRIGSVPL